MRKLLSFILLVALLSLSSGTTVIHTANAAPDSLLKSTTNETAYMIHSADTQEVWSIVVNQTNTGSARWTDFGYNSPSSLELSLPEVSDQAETGIKISPVTIGDIDSSNQQAGFYGYLGQSVEIDTLAPVYMNLYCDLSDDGISDYLLKTEMNNASDSIEEWVPYTADNDTYWQISAEDDIHGIADGSLSTWDELKTSEFTNDKILSASIYSYRGTENSALVLNVDSISLGNTVYDLGRIQEAINTAGEGDIINVHPGVYQEFLQIGKPLTVRSSDGAATTIIQPDSVPPGSDNVTEEYSQVVLISASDVVFQGFTVLIDGYLDIDQAEPDTGIRAADFLTIEDTEIPLSNVEITENIINIDNITNARAIEVSGCAGDAVISNNSIVIGKTISGLEPANGVDNASAVEIHKCENVQIDSNAIDLIVHGKVVFGVWVEDTHQTLANNNSIAIDFECEDFNGDYDGIEGIFFEGVSLVQANNNGITISGVGNQGYIEGIGLWDFDNQDFTFNRSEFSWNTIILNSSNPPVEEVAFTEILEDPDVDLYGIWAEKGNKINAQDNIIRITADGLGQVYLEGLTVLNIYDSFIYNNTITLKGEAGYLDSQYLRNSSKHPVSISTETINKDIFGITAIELDSAAETYGIRVENSDDPEIIDNVISAELEVRTLPVVTDDNVTDFDTTGLSYAVGMSVSNADSPQIENNRVEVKSNLLAGIVSDNVTEPGVQGNGISIALGLVMTETPDVMVSNNKIQAESYGTGGAIGIQPVLLDNAILSNLQSAILDNLDSALTEVEGQAGQVKPTQSNLLNGSLALFGIIGIGILAYDASNAQIKDNDPVSGIAQGNITAISMDGVEFFNLATAAGAALGLGGGILLINCDQAVVMDNGVSLEESAYRDGRVPSTNISENGVIGYSYMRARVSSHELTLTESAISAGLNAGISFGILGLNTSGLLESAAESANLSVTGNHVMAYGRSLTNINSITNVEEGEILSAGLNAGLRLGIGALVDTAVIEGNEVIANDESIIQSESSSDNESYPQAIGANISLALGIVTYGDGAGQIVENIVEVDTDGSAETLALEDSTFVPFDANATSGALSLGTGILVIGGHDQTIQGNDSEAVSQAMVYVGSISGTQLDESEVTLYAANLSSSLVLIGCTGNQNITQNHFAADAQTGMVMYYGATFTNTAATAIHLKIDILVINSDANINYNDIVVKQYAISGVSSFDIIAVDCGLLNIGSQINARYNYWGSPTGPGSPGKGSGESLVDYTSEGIEYSWWLSHPVADLQNDHVGYYGFSQSLEAGWNTLSVPMALENSTWTHIVEMSNLDYEIAYYYDPTQEYPWQQALEDNPETEIDESYIVKPLDGMYIKMKSTGTIFFTTGISISLPTRELSLGQSWYLVGVTPYDENYPFTTEMPVEDAFYTLLETPDGLQGMTGVVSPTIGGQEPWYWTTQYSTEHYVKLGKAYWVFMKNPNTLYGFIPTPLPVNLPAQDTY